MDTENNESAAIKALKALEGDNSSLIEYVRGWDKNFKVLETNLKIMGASIDASINEIQEHMRHKQLEDIYGEDYDTILAKMRARTTLHSVWMDDTEDGKFIIHGMFAGENGVIKPLQVLNNRPELNKEAYLDFWKGQVGRTYKEVNLIIMGIMQKHIVEDKKELQWKKNS